MSDIRVQFDAMIQATIIFSRQMQIRDLRAEAERGITKNCGNCDYWMKSSSCPLEARGKKPSMSHHPCNKYEETFWTRKLYNERQEHIRQLEASPTLNNLTEKQG